MGPDFLDRQSLWFLCVVILFVFCFVLFKTAFSSRISGKRNRISGRIPDIKKGRISGATLNKMSVMTKEYRIIERINAIPGLRTWVENDQIRIRHSPKKNPITSKNRDQILIYP